MAGRGAYLLRRDINTAQEELEKQATKKSLWGSWGRLLGGIAATALTGGAAAPWAAGLMAAGGSAIGGAVLSNQVRMKGTGQSAKFFKGARADLQKDLGALGDKNITQSLMAGITAGTTQGVTNLTASGKAAVAARKLAGRGPLDFSTSFVGKGIESGTNLMKAYSRLKNSPHVPIGTESDVFELEDMVFDK